MNNESIEYIAGLRHAGKITGTGVSAGPTRVMLVQHNWRKSIGVSTIFLHVLGSRGPE